MHRIFRVDRILSTVYAALFLGFVVALSLLWTQKGIHVSGMFALLCPSGTGAVALNDATSCSIHSISANKDWIAWMVAGMFGGAFVTALWRNQGFAFVIERGAGVRPAVRLLLAAVGGVVVGVGAAMAGGCTSSIGLTGSALLSVAGFAFLGVFFVGGFAARIFFGRFWHV